MSIVPSLAVAADGARADRPEIAWTEVKWPFLIDQWGLGRAFQCKAADCGVEVMLYLRAKVGFCNCSTGVAEDEEIDRVGDISLIGAESRPRAAGTAVTVGWMMGRSRPFVVEGPNQPRRYALTVALANKCDAVVATVVAERTLLPRVERSALEFLGSPPMLLWAASSAGS